MRVTTLLKVTPLLRGIPLMRVTTRDSAPSLPGNCPRASPRPPTSPLSLIGLRPMQDMPPALRCRITSTERTTSTKSNRSTANNNSTESNTSAKSNYSTESNTSTQSLWFTESSSTRKINTSTEGMVLLRPYLYSVSQLY